MKNLTKQFLSLALILFVSLSLKAVGADTTKLIGQWGGNIEYAERLEAINIVFNKVNNVYSGTISLVYDKENMPLEDISWNDPKICFASKYDKGKITFNGEIVGGLLKGKIIIKTPRVGSLSGEFELKKGKFIEKDILFLQRLKAYADYKNEKVNAKYMFSYMDSSDINLHTLKIKYNLDSVEGNGNELDKIINLMKWVHKVIPYNGHSGYIKPANSLYLLECETARNKGLCCYMKSIILNDIYLAMGYPSRVIHCLPKGDNYIEDHYINIVYSKKLNKWLYMDSSVGGYFKDDNGNLLSIQEVREKMINGEKIEANNDILLPNDLYQHYMTKNLFRFECSFVSKFNFESMDKKIYCRLNPRSYIDSSSNENKYMIVSNPDYFWAKPN